MLVEKDWYVAVQGIVPIIMFVGLGSQCLRVVSGVPKWQQVTSAGNFEIAEESKINH